jgi:hypothetical protein
LMIPHHQGAIDVARAELKYGHNEGVRRIAQSMIAERENEISLVAQSNTTIVAVSCLSAPTHNPVGRPRRPNLLGWPVSSLTYRF